ncbi:nuclear transport factor 2 family protein [Solilutibacter silvestris]|uniref:nuclear transport factor 2 family protein n=1 Tax=Solilutibacter silvestris TaxID=1645665 RepID=UPI003D32E049
MRKIIAIALLLASSTAIQAADSGPKDADYPLYAVVSGLDRQLFDAYNACDLKTFRGLLADDVEFYHDQGGLMLGADALTKAVHDNICGKVRRELVPGSLETDKIEGYGAIELGAHRFCEIATGKCVGEARFLHIWRHDGGQWKATRIVSFAHRPLKDGK